MTIKELIERLSQLDENIEVVVVDNDGTWEHSSNITFITEDLIVIE